MTEGYKRAIQEKRFEYKGFPCVVVMQSMGFRTGYVGIPKSHPLYGWGYQDIDISCHGGLTYSHDSLVDQDDKDTWWIGFDCGHFEDGYDFETAKKLFKDYPGTIRRIEVVQKTDLYGSYTSAYARSLSFCEEECRAIVEQLLKD